ncbi:MAG: 50S ribosomal protein L32 [Leptospiraceae bacterium]|nr:50S ribosomal protein L32 [Leptospiraceae bacterium]MDW8306416.1 50S ribosomal protein L32 [Leptospiraceae bacterium]
MAVPKRKTSHSKKGMRRSHHALGKPNLRPCPNCGAYGLSHRVCPNCGYYKGRIALAPKVRTVKET